MEGPMKYIDLHIHTNKSDGFLEPKEVIALAKSTQTKVIAISDHDSIDGLLELKSNLYCGMIGINAVEFSSYIINNGTKIRIHVLGYGFDSKSRELLNLLKEMNEKRINAHIDLLKFLRMKIRELPEERISKLNMDRYCWFDREIIKCMELENYSPETIEKWKKYFKLNKFSYGEYYDLDVKRVISAIKNANGFAVLAHPMVYKLSRMELENIVSDLVLLGLDGIEIYQSDCSVSDSLYLKNLADKNNLLCSVGSDFHRSINSDGRLIGRGINDNLCVEQISLVDKVLEKKKYFVGNS